MQSRGFGLIIELIINYGFNCEASGEITLYIVYFQNPEIPTSSLFIDRLK